MKSPTLFVLFIFLFASVLIVITGQHEDVRMFDRDFYISSSSLYSGITKQPSYVKDKRSIINYRNKRIMEVSELTTTYQEVQELISIEERFGPSPSLNTRKTKLYNLGNLINTLMEEVEMLDVYCEKRVGPDCNIPTCFGKYHQGNLMNEPCNRNGVCADVDKCVCNKGFHGLECQIFECFGVPANETTCSGNGKCISMNLCKCNIGYGGLNCNQIISSINFPIIVDNNEVRHPASGNYIPKSCKEYYDKSNGNDKLVNGYYKIRPWYFYNETDVTVFCNMEEGGYTLLDGNILKSNYIEYIMKGTNEVKTSYGSRCTAGNNFIDVNLHFDTTFQFLCHNIGGRHRMRFKLMDLMYISPFKYWAK